MRPSLGTLSEILHGPIDFKFQLNESEWNDIQMQSTFQQNEFNALRSQIVTSKGKIELHTPKNNHFKNEHLFVSFFFRLPLNK